MGPPKMGRVSGDPVRANTRLNAHSAAGCMPDNQPILANLAFKWTKEQTQKLPVCSRPNSCHSLGFRRTLEAVGKAAAQQTRLRLV